MTIDRAKILRGLQNAGSETSDFDLNPDVSLPKERRLRPAAVLIPIQVHETEMRLVLTKRSSALKHHPGQIAFPGGKVDSTDGSVVDAALREAREEIGLPSERVEVLGAMPEHETVTSFSITPIVGIVQGSFDPIPEAGEVQEVFSVPLEFVLDVANFKTQGRIWQGQMRHYETVPYGPYYIWGATARILKAFAERVSA